MEEGGGGAAAGSAGGGGGAGTGAESQSASNKKNYEPKHNREYKTKEYWEQRFESEEEYEWLAGFAPLAPHLEPLIARLLAEAGTAGRPLRTLVVGCGNSRFSEELVGVGRLPNVLSIDFSANVINAMKEKYRGSQIESKLNWAVMDMTDMKLGPGEPLFDCVLDKAAMDALVTDEGDPWNPNEETVESTGRMMASVARILRPRGTFAQVSFQQPHFRKKYLLNPHLSEPQVETIDHGMGYFFFTQRRLEN